MTKHIKLIPLILFSLVLLVTSCKKDEYSFGELKAPTGLALTAAVAGMDAANPNGNGTGNVAITATSTGALSYNIDFGDGTSKVVPSGIINYKYSTPGVGTYTISVNAIGTGGSLSTISKKITVFVAFEIPPAIVSALTNGASRVWVTDKGAPGHFGVGAADMFIPNYYAAGPDSREACAYDDEITFTKNANGTISMTIDSKGSSFSIGAATASYGVSGGDGCYAINTGGTRNLVFMNATSASTPAISTRIQFSVPGNGIINFGTGGTVYEILSITATTVHLRNIGADGNSWYQKLKVKP